MSDGPDEEQLWLNMARGEDSTYFNKQTTDRSSHRQSSLLELRASAYDVSSDSIVQRIEIGNKGPLRIMVSINQT